MSEQRLEFIGQIVAEVYGVAVTSLSAKQPTSPAVVEARAVVMGLASRCFYFDAGEISEAWGLSKGTVRTELKRFRAIEGAGRARLACDRVEHQLRLDRRAIVVD